MFTLQVDLGQVLLGLLITTIGFLMKREINRFDYRLNRHDEVLEKLIRDTQRLIGTVSLLEREHG